MLNIRDRQRDLEKAGADGGERARQLGLDVLGATGSALGNLSGTVPLARMLLRAGGFTAEDADAHMAEAYSNIFDTAEARQRKKSRTNMAIAKAAADVNKQFEDDNAFLDTWTPEDFVVGGEADRDNFRAEFKSKNRKYINALHDLRLNEGMNKAAQDSRGD